MSTGVIKAPLEHHDHDHDQQHQKDEGVREFTNEQDVLNAYNQLSSECEAGRQKINEFKSQSKEHELVIDAIRDLDGERKCFRLIGGVLVERTVKEVLPAVQQNKEQLDGVCVKIEETLVMKERELMQLKRRYKIRARGEVEEEDEDEENDT